MNRRQFPAVMLIVFILAACAAQPPAPVVEAKPAPLAAGADPGVLLGGKVVTMNDAGDVLTGARLWIRDGRIEAVLRADEVAPAAAAGAREVDSGGVIYPGLIDIHNHPEYAVFPLMPITRKYKDRYEWRNYDYDYTRRIEDSRNVLINAEYYNLGMDVGRYGEYMALAGGTTSLQGGGSSYPLTTAAVLHGGLYFRPYAKSECLARNIETTSVADRKAYSHVDIGRDVTEWKRLQDNFKRGTIIVHLAEGTSTRMADEFRYIKAAGLLGANLVVIHGVGLTDVQLKEMGVAGAKLVWSPLSNFLLYGKTANVRAAKEATVAISLAPDWGPSGSKSVLGELKVADLVNRDQLKSIFGNRELVDMVTRNPAKALGWENQLGQVRQGFLADLVVVDDRQPDVYRNLIASTEENVRLVVVRGEALYGDSRELSAARAASPGIEEAAVFKGGRSKSIAPNCPGSGMPDSSVKEVRKRLQEALQFDAAYTAHVVSREQIAKDLAQCNEARPGEPPDVRDTRRMLSCRFGLPFEKTDLAPLTTAEDQQFFSRLLANPNIPAYLKRLPAYYRN
ncbi:MAG: amidohydrolase family protein [Betaproteobacteria bacterium]